jgi:hypothetical protein
MALKLAYTKLLALYICAHLCACATPSTQAVSPNSNAAPAKEISDAERAEAELAISRGLRIFQHDRLAWVASDQVQGKFPTVSWSGWVVKEFESGAEVIWFDDKDRVRASVSFGDLEQPLNCIKEKNCSGIGISALDRNPSAEELTLLKMQKRAIAESPAFCTSERPNWVAFKEKDRWLAYVLSASSDVSKVVVHGHTRFEFDGSGELLQTQALYKNCMVLDVDPNQVPAMLTATTLTSKLFNEGHVFAALNANITLAVMGTSRQFIIIDPSSIPPRWVAPRK